MKSKRNTTYFQQPIVLIGSVMPIAVILMFLFLGEKSLWLDEAISVSFAQRELVKLFKIITAREADMSAYYLLLHFWLKLGTDEFSIRSLSAIFMLFTVPVMYFLGAHLAGKRAGVIAMILFITNGSIIHYAQEARSYALTVFLVTTASYLLTRNAKRPSAMNWAGYVITTALSVYAHFFAFLVFVAHVFTMIVTARRSSVWKSYFISGSLIVVLLIPLGIFVVFKGKGQVSWIPEPLWQDLIFIFGFLSGAMFFSVWSWLLGIFYSFLCLASVYFGFRKRQHEGLSEDMWGYHLLIIWLLLPIIVTFAVSQIKPLFVYRYLIICIPPLILLASIGISHIKNSRLLFACLAILLVLSSRHLLYQYTELEKEDWRSVVRHVVSNTKANDAIVFYKSYASPPFYYYFERLNTSGVELTPYAFKDNHIELYRDFHACKMKKPPPHSQNNFESLYERAWLVLYRTSNEEQKAIQEYFMSHYRVGSKATIEGPFAWWTKRITILLLEKDTG